MLKVTNKINQANGIAFLVNTKTMVLLVLLVASNVKNLDIGIVRNVN